MERLGGDKTTTKKNNNSTIHCMHMHTHTHTYWICKDAKSPSLLFSPPPLIEESGEKIEDGIQKKTSIWRNLHADGQKSSRYKGIRTNTRTHARAFSPPFCRYTHAASQRDGQLSNHQLHSQPVIQFASQPNNLSIHLSSQPDSYLTNHPFNQLDTQTEAQAAVLVKHPHSHNQTALRHRRHKGLQRFCDRDTEGKRVRDTYRVHCGVT